MQACEADHVVDPIIQASFYIMDPEAIGDHARAEFERVLKEDFTGTSVGELIEMAKLHEVQLWKLDAPETSGYFATRVLDYPAGKELFVWLMVGNKLTPYNDLCFARLKEFAQAVGCGWIRALCLPWVARWMNDNTELRTRYECMFMEV